MSDKQQISTAVNLQALEIDIEHTAVPSEHDPSSGTTTGYCDLGNWNGLETGVWEMSTGIMHDTEADEIFIVLRGQARIEFLEPARAAISVQAGSVVRLDEGMRTRWTVTEGPLRKVYLTPA